MGTVTKGTVGEQDAKLYDGVNPTFTRKTSTGGTITLNEVGYEVDCAMVYAGGVNFNDATISLALTAIGGTNQATLVLRPGTWTISNNVTIPSNITLKPVPGALVTVAAGKTLTLNTTPIAGSYQWIFGTGTVTINDYPIDQAWWGNAESVGFGTMTATTATITTATITNLTVTNLTGGNSTIDNSINDFRLTLTSGTPVTTNDVTGATTIYACPYKGTRIALYNGSTWQIDTSAQFSLALGTLTANLPYDVFVHDVAGTPTLSLLAWSNTTTRATALAYQDGILSLTGALTYRYLGTFYSSSTTATADAAATRYLENYYNQVDRPLSGTFSANRSTASTTYVELNSEIEIKFVMGNNDNPVRLAIAGSNYSGGGGTLTGIGIDSTSTATAGLEAASFTSAGYSGPIAVSNSVSLAVGYHYATLLGKVSSGFTAYWIAANTMAGGGTSEGGTDCATKVYLTAVKKG